MAELSDFPKSRSLDDLSAEEAEEILVAAQALRAELAIRIAEDSELNAPDATDTTEE